MPRPNILLLMADQLAAQWLPAYGHDIVQAPHLDRLAREGVVFESAYCAVAAVHAVARRAAHRPAAVAHRRL